MNDADPPDPRQPSASDDATHTASESAFARASAPPLAPGALIDRFVLLKRIGEGGMGSVWAAYDGELDRKIAIKLVLPERAGDEHVRARMLREAQALARLSHPNVVTVHEVGVHGDQIYVAMEHVEGETLKAWLQREPVGPPRLAGLLEILRQAGRGLAAAHAADMVHRDFKPANVIVGADGRVRVVDFGLARVHAGVTAIVRDELVATFREDALRSSSGDSQRSPASGLEAEVTAAGTFVGTP
ncbi:MAG: serine/threonine protein kinase, partial [Deltaproteobacteria bacterium]|nr:serine/threonine protein kinase [Nannocystaceae bacterium]